MANGQTLKTGFKMTIDRMRKLLKRINDKQVTIAARKKMMIDTTDLQRSLELDLMCVYAARKGVTAYNKNNTCIVPLPTGAHAYDNMKELKALFAIVKL